MQECNQSWFVLHLPFQEVPRHSPPPPHSCMFQEGMIPPPYLQMHPVEFQHQESEFVLPSLQLVSCYCHHCWCCYCHHCGCCWNQKINWCVFVIYTVVTAAGTAGGTMWMLIRSGGWLLKQVAMAYFSTSCSLFYDVNAEEAPKGCFSSHSCLHCCLPDVHTLACKKCYKTTIILHQDETERII